MATPRGPRPGNLPPNFNQNALANNMQNLQINHPNQQHYNDLGVNAPRPPPNTTPFGQYPQTFAGTSGPPPSGVPRGHMPPNAPAQNLFPPNVMSTRPVGPPSASQPTPPFASRPPPPSIGGVSGPGVRPGPFSSSPSGLPNPNQNASGPVSNGQLLCNPGIMQNGPPFPPRMGSMPAPHQDSQTLLTSGLSSHPPQMRPGFGNPPPLGVPTSMGQPPPPFSAQPQRMPPPPGTVQFPVMGPGGNQYPGSPYGMQTWPQQPQQVVQPPPGVGSMQQQPIFGMPPPPPGIGPMQQQQMLGIPPPNLPNRSMALMAHTGQSNIDPGEIPRFAPNSSLIWHDTRQDNQANPPPPVTSNYIVRDTGNCNPRYLRCTINQIPCSVDLLSTSAMQLALLVQPFALPHPSEDPIQVVDFGESGPVRCSRCKGYINPFVKFIDQGRRFICNLCGFTDETPREYVCHLGPDGRRRDADERPELCRGTVEFVASKEYMVRDPMPAVFFFLIDVSMNAVQTGATAAACSAISQVIADLPEGPRTMVGIATFDSTIHFYNIKRAQQQLSMLIVPDIQDVYTPLQSDVIVQLAECREHLEMLLESIPTMFQTNRTADSAFGAAVKAAFLVMKSTGGKLLVFQSVLPSIGLGSLSARETEGRSNASAGEKEAHKLLQPADKSLKTLAFEYAEYQVCIDLFITAQSYVDIASLSVFPKTTGGQVYYYYPFSAVSDSAKLYNDLRWNVTRPQGFEAVMRVRCSQGIQVQDYSGNFCKRIPTDVDLPAIDCDKAIVVSLKHDDKLQEGSEFSFQSALLYTTIYGQRRIRVSTLSLPCTNMVGNLFRSADLDTQFACILKQAANEIPSAPLQQVRDHTTKHCFSILAAYRKCCSTVSSTSQLILPESLKLLPLFVIALLKSSGLRSDGRIDEKSFWINYVSSLTTPLVIPLVYPRMVAIDYIDEKELDDESVIPAAVPLCSEHVTEEGIYLLENGLDCFVYVGNSVPPTILRQLFGISSVEEISNQFILEQYDNPLSKKLNAIVNEIRRQRCSFLRLTLCRKGDSSGTMFFSFMVEDKSPSGPSYVEFLVHTHRQVQAVMDKS